MKTDTTDYGAMIKFVAGLILISIFFTWFTLNIL
jgi:hypothetical protein